MWLGMTGVLLIALIFSLVKLSRYRWVSDKNAATMAEITPTRVKYRDFPPDFWRNDMDWGEFKDWNLYISEDNKLAFKYPKNMVVFQNGSNDNIYIFPVERVMKGDFDLTAGMVIILEKYPAGEFALESGSKLVGYQSMVFRSDLAKFEDVSGVTFFNETNKTYIRKSEVFESEYPFVYLVYNTQEEERLGNVILGTMASSNKYELEKYRQMSTNNQNSGSTPKYANAVESKNLGIRLFLPDGYTWKEVPLGDSYHKLNISKDKCRLSISDNPEYVGYSTSGALCANTGPPRCVLASKYLIPGMGVMTVARETYPYPDVAYFIKGVYYGNKLSADLSATGYQPACIPEVVNILSGITFLD